jgi:ABC-type transport system substrate-binding protein
LLGFTGSEFNIGGFENADFDNLVNKGKEVNDPAERQQIYILTEQIINEEVIAVIPLFHFRTKSQ